VGLLLGLQVVSKPVAKLAIPGLKLTGADTKDGSSAVGKGTVLTMKTTSSSDSSSEAESEDDAPPVRYPLCAHSSCSPLTHGCASQPVVAKIAIPGLKLTGADTKDGSTTVGRGTVLLKSTANTSQNSSLEDLRSPVRAATIPTIATPAAATAVAESDSDASSSDSDEDAAAMPPPAPVSKLAIPGLKLTGADTKDGSSAVGKGTVLTLKAMTSASHDEPAPGAEGSTTSSDESESDDEDGEESKV
jgi:hypothetical protein